MVVLRDAWADGPWHVGASDDADADDSGRCANGLSVETTAWEGWRARQQGGESVS